VVGEIGRCGVDDVGCGVWFLGCVVDSQVDMTGDSAGDTGAGL